MKSSFSRPDEVFGRDRLLDGASSVFEKRRIPDKTM
jgi:hypothetical protein